MSKNILLLTGSPRKDGNTARLAAAFREGAEAEGKSVTEFFLADLKINGCLGCCHCFEEKGVCIQKDDMLDIHKAMTEADAIVFASPVYYFNVSAQLKAAIDRFFALLEVEIPVKKAALLMTSGDTAPGVAEAAVVMLKNICDFSKWESAGVIVAGGLHDPGDIEGREELEKALSLGKEI